MKQKIKREDSAIKKASWTGTISLLFLLLLFLMVTLSSTNELASQIELLTKHPFAVSGDISDVKTNLAVMRIYAERMQSYNQPEDIEKVQMMLNSTYAEVEELLYEIESLYLGPAQDTKALRNSFEDIRKAHDLFLEFARLPGSGTKEIAEYEETNLYPLYEEFEKDAETILSFVRKTQQSIFISAEKMSSSTLVWSITIIGAMILGLLFFQYTIRKISWRLYEKNRQFEILSETVDEAFLIFGKDQERCDFVSGRTDKILGLSASRLLENRALIYDYMTREDAEKIQREINSGTRNAWDIVIQYNRPESAELNWLQFCFYRTGENEDMKYIVTLTDRTEERRASQALEDALVSAQNANNAKRDFLSRMSHEIRTPMNAIIGMTTIAAASIQDQSRVEDCLGKISYSSKHLLMLINDVLDMSRIESNRMGLNKEPFELFQFLNTFVSVVYPQADSKGLEFIEKTNGFSEHTTYLGDSLRLNQILLNLTSNAIKFTPEGGTVRLEVTHLRFHDKKCWLRFVVSDTGIGMNESALERLYMPFEQADASIARRYGGTGLGMSITQNLVSLMGGVIDVKSKPGQGTTFTVDLPFEQSGVDLEPFCPETLEVLHVLVADDEQDICEHTVLLLEKMKIHAEWVLSGMEAVQKVISAQETGHEFDVCFIDWKMPDMDGVETTRQIRKKIGPDTLIIVISAYDWSDIEKEAREAGANAFIAKPLFQSSLYNVLVTVTNGAFGRTGTKTEASGAEKILQGKRLLLAEDNELNMEIAISLLEMNGAAVEGVENGKKAVDCFLQSKPGYFDAILMDMQMPVMDGCEAVRQIRASDHADARNIPVVATTANAFVEDVSAALAAGMNAHISKPLDIGRLCSILAQLCGDKKKY